MYKAKYLQPRPRTGADTVLQLKLYNGMMITDRVFDYSLNGVTVTVYNRNDPDTCLPVYPGFHFEGIYDYIYTNSGFQSTFRDSFSMMIWVKPDDGQPAAEDVLAGEKSDTDPTEDQVSISIQTTGKIRFTVESDDDVAYAEGNAATFADGAGAWTHIAAVATKDTSLRIYVNGELLTLGAAPADGDATGLTFADYTIGACNFGLAGLNGDETIDGITNPFAGLISDFRMYNRVLSATEVKSTYSVTRSRYGV